MEANKPEKAEPNLNAKNFEFRLSSEIWEVWELKAVSRFG
jgi:hypothetical protein